MEKQIMTENNVFQPILVSWFMPYTHIEQRVVCRTQSQLDYFRENLHVKHWEKRLYTIIEGNGNTMAYTFIERG